MPIATTYPGVYVEELPSDVHTITGVSTAVTAFLGYFKQGPMNKPVQIFSVADLERNFGILDVSSEAAYGIRQFFANGGAEAWVVRVAASTSSKPLAKASIDIEDAPSGGAAVFTATALSEGSWGNDVRLAVDYNTANPATAFNLTVTLVDNSSPPKTQATEIYRNLVIDQTSPYFAPAVVNATSVLVNLTLKTGAANPPAATGTLSADISTDPTDLNATLGALHSETMQVQLGGTTLGTVTYPTTTPTSLNQAATTLQGMLQALSAPGQPPAIPNTTVSVIQDTPGKVKLQISTVSSTPTDTLTFTGNLAGALELDVAATLTNVQQYALGGSAASAQTNPTTGADGDQPDGTAIIGDPLAKTGIYALDNAPGFNLLCLPDVMNLGDNDAFAVISAAETYCQPKYAFLIVDPPQGGAGQSQRDSIVGIQNWLTQNATLRSSYAALYFPRPQIPDPLNGFRLRSVAASGTLAGLYAQTDGTRGVWKAPAGTAAVLKNVSALTYVLSDSENGVLNPVGINCLRNLPVFGEVSWGARTLDGADQRESQWKYIPVRRLALYIEASLYQGTQWVVFEPNDEPLWSQIRLNVGTFMQQLFLQGAFQGSTPATAYFVKCDHSTTTQADINQGVVNIVVGFAPLLPAEFVILQIQQIAGPTPT